MNQIVIRTLDGPTIYRLKQLAWQQGRPLEDLARLLLIEAVHLSAAVLPGEVRTIGVDEAHPKPPSIRDRQFDPAERWGKAEFWAGASARPNGRQ